MPNSIYYKYKDFATVQQQVYFSEWPKFDVYFVYVYVRLVV